MKPSHFREANIRSAGQEISPPFMGPEIS